MPRLSEADRRFLVHLVDPKRLRLIEPYLYRREGDEWRAFCPLHQQPGDKEPHAGINFTKDKWNCFGPSCKAHGRASDMLRDLERDHGNNVVSIDTGEPVEAAVKLPSLKALKQYHGVLMSRDAALNWLYEHRGLTDDTLREWGIGYNNGMPRPNSFIIPVLGRDGKTLIAVRLYKNKVKHGSPKMTYWGRPGRTFLFNAEILDDEDEVVISAGEWDCILNNQMGIPTVSHTAGESNWRPEWSREFEGKTVFICYDDDDAGHEGALKVARALEGIAAKVFIMTLDTGIKGGDITDFYVKLGNDVDDFRERMEVARAEGPFTTSTLPTDIPLMGKPVALIESQNPDNAREALDLSLMIVGKAAPPYIVPKSFIATCDQSKGKICQVCPMKRFGGSRVVNIQPNDERILQFIGIRDSDGPMGTKKHLLAKIAEAKCTDRSEFKVDAEYAIEEMMVNQSVHHRTEEAQQPLTRQLYSVGTYNTQVNSDQHVIAKQIPDPRSSQGLLQAWHVEPMEVDIDKFKMTPELMEDLAIFQNERGTQSPLEKCLEIAEDLSANVTRIYGRDLMHVAYDLVWHSVMSFDLLGRREPKGWMDALIIGDTRTGKSEVASMLMRHYNAGIVKSCEGATFAGLVGGAQQFGTKRWTVSWGTIPLQDRRLVVLDEFSGLKDKDVIERMSSVRSSGIAELTMIAAEQTSARTRLIWVSNPVNGMTLAQHAGHRAIGALVKQPEDVARFDFAMAVRNDEVESSVINTLEHPEVEHVYTTDLCSALVMWAWSRTAEQVKWHKGSDEELIRIAQEMGESYFPDPPLVQAANIRIKLARIAVAFAARTFSTNKTGENIVVRPEHVRSAREFLDLIYSSDAMGYKYQSDKRIRDMKEAKKNKRRVRKWLADNDGVLSVLEAVQGQTFRPQDFDGATDAHSGQDVVRYLRDLKLIRRVPGNNYVIEPALSEVLRDLEG